MPYIGRGIETLSDRVVLDSLTASATASYTLQLNSVNFVPSSAESLTVSLNGVIQKPGSSYTVSSSTLSFSSALTSSDSIDFIIAERGITLQTPSAGSVGTSQLASTAVTTAKIADDAVTFDKMTGQNYPAFMATQNATQTISNNTATKVQFQSKSWDTDSAFDNTTNYRFTIPSGKAGKYVFFYAIRISNLGDGDIFQIQIYKNGTLENRSRQISNMGVADNAVIRAQFADDGSVGDYYEVYVTHNYGSNRSLNLAFSNFVGYRIGD